MSNDHDISDNRAGGPGCSQPGCTRGPHRYGNEMFKTQTTVIEKGPQTSRCPARSIAGGPGCSQPGFTRGRHPHPNHLIGTPTLRRSRYHRAELYGRSSAWRSSSAVRSRTTECCGWMPLVNPGCEQPGPSAWLSLCRQKNGPRSICFAARSDSFHFVVLRAASTLVEEARLSPRSRKVRPLGSAVAVCGPLWLRFGGSVRA